MIKLHAPEVWCVAVEEIDHVEGLDVVGAFVDHPAKSPIRSIVVLVDGTRRPVCEAAERVYEIAWDAAPRRGIRRGGR